MTLAWSGRSVAVLWSAVVVVGTRACFGALNRYGFIPPPITPSPFSVGAFCYPQFYGDEALATVLGFGAGHPMCGRAWAELGALWLRKGG